MIERVIHQMWGFRDSGPMPSAFAASQRSWRERHPGWTHILWTPDKVETLVRDHYPEVWPLYRSYPDWVQRADAGRYMILHRHGGLYSDLDILCRKPFDEFLPHAIVLPKTAPVGFSNDLMMAEKGHPFMAALIAALGPAQARWGRRLLPRHLRIMMTTGPLFLTLQSRRLGPAGSIFILPHPVYDGPDEEARYVTHTPGNSWAGWDTHLLVFAHRRWRWLLGAIALLAAALALR